MTDKVEYHKQWRQKKKQSLEQLQAELVKLNDYCDTLLETTSTVNAQLKRFAPLLTLSDEQLEELIRKYER